MKITDLQKRKNSLIAMYINGEFVLDIDKKTIDESEFKIGSDITDESLFFLINLSKYNRAKSRALYLLSKRDYSSKELYIKLKERFEDQICEKVVQKMQQIGYINDQLYAQRYAKYLLEIKLYSLKKTEFELSQKGIDRYLIEDILCEINPEPQKQIVQIIEKKYKNKCKNEKGVTQTVAGLQRMGYNWSDIKKVLDTYCVLNCDEDE